MTDTLTLDLDRFLGAWDLHRTIADRLTSSDSRFTGTASFETRDCGLLYAETGILHMVGQTPFKAERRYLWRQEDDRIVVDFEDGRPFHSFAPGDPTAMHWCDPDTYKVVYDFTNWPAWQSTWRVSGPRKAYTMVSTYARAAH
ncbi:DUF6314 family protein [Marivita hallyeonensis]|uniref:DUF6314 domain-containing protein n=1 Tax=Marivita hallyeonensis TaxID=996342 RepID=A0A1M5VKW8_9RHOB|nr:DUF6314 family protein [Marivita hallyeonensis]SHH75916.1 hypothetical protein SAMN05443551_2929 [Marivita hallyeonensis]